MCTIQRAFMTAWMAIFLFTVCVTLGTGTRVLADGSGSSDRNSQTGVGGHLYGNVLPPMWWQYGLDQAVASFDPSPGFDQPSSNMEEACRGVQTLHGRSLLSYWSAMEVDVDVEKNYGDQLSPAERRSVVRVGMTAQCTHAKREPR